MTQYIIFFFGGTACSYIAILKIETLQIKEQVGEVREFPLGHYKKIMALIYCSTYIIITKSILFPASQEYKACS